MWSVDSFLSALENLGGSLLRPTMSLRGVPNMENVSDCLNCTPVVLGCELWSMNSNCAYLAVFASVSYLLFVVASVQLVLCMVHDSFKGSSNSSMHVPHHMKWKKAFRTTVQKCLLGAVVMATGTRAIYFTVQHFGIPEGWADILFTLYYPALLSAFSLLVCFWAESYYYCPQAVQSSSHTGPTGPEKHHFLKEQKSSVAWALFNLPVYLLLFADIVATPILGENEQEQARKNGIIGSIFALMLFLVFIGFLHFSIRLFFRPDWNPLSLRLEDFKINPKQQVFSIVGIVSNAVMQFLIIGFLVFNLVNQFKPLDQHSQYVGSLVIRVTELALPIWFCCSLWNCKQPRNLWILNPGLLLQDIKALTSRDSLAHSKTPLLGQSPSEFRNYGSIEVESTDETSQLCWICMGEGELHHYCKCSVRSHSHCLQRWIATRAADSSLSEDECLRCQQCREKYMVQPDRWLSFRQGIKKKHWFIGVTVMLSLLVSGAAITCATLWLQNNIVKYLLIGITVVVDAAIIKFSGYSLIKLCRTSKLAGVVIIERQQQPTITSSSPPPPPPSSPPSSPPPPTTSLATKTLSRHQLEHTTIQSNHSHAVTIYHKRVESIHFSPSLEHSEQQHKCNS